MMMGLPLYCSVLLLLCAMTAAASSDSSSNNSFCEGIEIPYPFGVRGRAPAVESSFEVRCDGGSPTLSSVRTANASQLPIIEISLDGFVHVLASSIAEHCDWMSDIVMRSSRWIDLEGTPFTFSTEKNNLTVIGCDALSLIRLPGSRRFTSGCMTFCESNDGGLDHSCSGMGCCQAAIPHSHPHGGFTLKLRSIANATGYPGFASFPGNCSKTFLMQYDALTSSNYTKSNKAFPLVLEWVIGNKTCANAHLEKKSYACKDHTKCYDVLGVGYRCRCQPGFYGNPYLGCEGTGTRECVDPGAHDCVEEARCIEDSQGYRCACPKGMVGDGKIGGSGCTVSEGYQLNVVNEKQLKVNKENQLKVNIVVGAGIFCALVLLVGLFSHWLVQRRKLTKLKEIFFRQNGGLLLQRQLAALKGTGGGTRIFTTEEIQKATDNFSEGRILGRGGQGTVYKGFLLDKRTVAIKKSRISDETQIEQFINEVIILSQINHRNVVKLLGCCLETQVPLLVYEFVPNGTLSDHIHHDERPAASAPPLTWAQRLGIAAETAGALAYLHSAASIPIIHRDVKSSNILLDDRFTAKVADFGASRSVAFDKSHITTLVQGTLGYLDPEYFQTSQLTEKSDVYSFGVVLVELLTGEKPVSSVRPEEERNLASHFITSLEGKRLRRVLEAGIVREVGMEHLGVVARLARSCLSLKAEERPSMKEVAMELELARGFLITEQAGVRWNCSPANAQHFGSTTRQCSLEDEMLDTMDFPR